jgi:hypothetical protein
MAGVFEHHVEQFGIGWDGDIDWTLEVVPAGLPYPAYYHIELKNGLQIHRLQLAGLGADAVEFRCAAEVVGDKAELVVTEERSPPGRLAVLPSRHRVALLSKLTSEFMDWCRSDRLQVNFSNRNAPPQLPTHFIIESPT